MADFPHPCFRALRPNSRGRDYFVGDIHGHFHKLAASLERLGFNPAIDRLVSVGDLIDRGPESHLALDWLSYPWFHAVRGNHEELFLAWRSLRHHPAHHEAFEHQYCNDNGGAWIKQLSTSTCEQLEKAFLALPYFIAVPARGRTIGVVHAELPADTRWPDLLSCELSDEQLTTMTWSRNSWKAWRVGDDRLEPWITGLDAVVTGHNRVPEPQPWGNLVFIDTGAWKTERDFFILSADEILTLVDEGLP